MSDLAAQPTPIQAIYAWYNNNKLFVNRRYQRKLVWTLEEKQKLIDSILKKYPIPAILIAEMADKHETFEIIDGLQRLHAIVSFIEHGFATTEGKYFNLKLFPTAKSRATSKHFEEVKNAKFLSSKEVSTLLDYVMALSVMRNASDLEINDVFDRINTYGHRLSDQERRQSGVQNNFSDMVRKIACTIRGDESKEVLPLELMPSISVDLPKAKHGYEIQADEVFWVNQGILRSTDLRDSLDEQCIADIAACIAGGQLIARSKDALDSLYEPGSVESDRIEIALKVYGAESLAEEFKLCIDEILKVCQTGTDEKLRDFVFKTKNTNAFPAVFATIMLAIHELIFLEKKRISDYSGIKKAIRRVGSKLDSGRKGTSPEDRRQNIDHVKGIVGRYFIDAKPRKTVNGGHATSDINAAVRRSELEVADYELKQGILTLDTKRAIDPGIMDKIVQTICAIANNGPDRSGKLLIGVSDKIADTQRIVKIDNIKPVKIGNRDIVGVSREAKVLGISNEEYLAKIKTGIKSSLLSDKLKASVLSSIDYNSYSGLGIVIIAIPPQKEISFVGDELYWRDLDSTEHVKGSKLAANIAQRFK